MQNMYMAQDFWTAGDSLASQTHKVSHVDRAPFVRTVRWLFAMHGICMQKDIDFSLHARLHVCVSFAPNSVVALPCV